MNSKIIVLLLLLSAVATTTYGQYFNKLHDVDSMYDWGENIFLNNDGNYFIVGSSQKGITTRWDITNMTVSAGGNIILDKNVLQYPFTALGYGDAGSIKHLSSGGYIVPFTMQNPSTAFVTSAAGFMKYDETGDVVYVKLYTDTSATFDLLYNCALLPDGDFLGGGIRKYGNTATTFPGLLVRTDSNADTLWTRTYWKEPTQQTRIRTLIPLDDGRIVVGAESKYTYFIGSVPFYHHTPWFLVLDSSGNILKDTLYGTKYGGGGNIYKDINGGYIHYGWIDTVPAPIFGSSDLRNFPHYIAHLDTNFRMEWITRFPHDDCNSRRSPGQIKQLHDGNFLILGDDYCNGCLCAPAYSGWAAKIRRTNGEIMWNRNYWTDTDQVAYLRDMVELPDGNMVFTGSAFNDTLPSWHAGRDVWIFGTDSNGCYVPDCQSPIKVPEINSVGNNDLILFPNPTNGNVTIKAPHTGVLVIGDLQGRVIANYTLKGGKADIQLPAGISAGMYICRYVSDEAGSLPVVARLVYSP